MVLDFITDVDANKSEFISHETGTTIPLEFAENLLNINLEYWFQSLQELNTKLFFRVSLENKNKKALNSKSRFLGEKIELYQT